MGKTLPLKSEGSSVGLQFNLIINTDEFVNSSYRHNRRQLPGIGLSVLSLSKNEGTWLGVGGGTDNKMLGYASHYCRHAMHASIARPIKCEKIGSLIHQSSLTHSD